jgi:CheY-like chemotaxis protein
MPQAVFLLVEDNEDHIVLFKRAFSRSNVLNPLQVVRNGHEAICYLEGSGRYRNRHEFPLPSLVLLDLKLPGIDGFEVLTWIREQPSLRTLRVIVLTSSEEMRDVNRAYQLGANSFLVKPMELEDLNHLTQAINNYWLWLDKAPNASRPGVNSPVQPGH